MTSVMRRTATLTLALLSLALTTACASHTPPPTPTHTTTASPTPKPIAQQNPKERVQNFFNAADQAAAHGWKDLRYNHEFLVPDVAAKSEEGDKDNAATGAIITGPRHLTDWTTINTTSTTSIIEFCNNIRDQKASKDGHPVKIKNLGIGEWVGRFTLTRRDDKSPWMIKEMGYYPEGTTCAQHFGK
ncbi:hypothetical protein [Devriesea agamarum]|uniref:hypothetical protein n=1 Tax=Devriesea agamarum TaxID=472569 RepID=UPI00071D4BC1|nr:hypothetical protein [Devriesea agamarum]